MLSSGYRPYNWDTVFIGKFLCPFFSLVMNSCLTRFMVIRCAMFDCLLIMSGDKCLHSMAALIPRSFLSLG